MRLVVQKIYRVPVTPSCDIISLDDELFNAFLKADDDKRKNIVCDSLSFDYPEKVKEVTWFPLDGQDRVIVSGEKDDFKGAKVKVVIPANHVRIVFKLRYRDERNSQVDALILDSDEWKTFLHGDARVKVHVVCKRLGCDDKSDEVKEVAWFIGLHHVVFLKGEDVYFEKKKPTRVIVTKDMIEGWRSRFIAELWVIHKNAKDKLVSEDDIKAEISGLKEDDIKKYIKLGLSPEICASEAFM